MRVVLARRIGKRGEGLGNEMLAWSKGFIASHVLRATLVGPSWGLNRRKYYRNFGTSRFDFVLEELLGRLPSYKFTERDYIASGYTDFGNAVRQWAEQKGLLKKTSYIVIVDGMYGGYAAIRTARPFLLAKLLASRDALENMYQVMSQIDPHKLFAAVHMRLGGDFSSPPTDQQSRGKFNVRIPVDWYERVCGALQHAFGDQIQFYFFSDVVNAQYENLVSKFNRGQLRQSGLTECSDLAIMAEADLRICSVSSYSLAASFLAQGPYIWYESQLTYERGCYSLWGHEPNQRLPGSLTATAIENLQHLSAAGDHEELFQGFPVRNDGALPGLLISQLHRKLRAKNASTNLLQYGVVPDWAVSQ